MSDLPSGLASISSQFDDSPHVRGAVAFGQAQAKKREGVNYTPPGFCPVRWISREEAVEIYGEPEQEDFDRHAALVIGAGFRSADRR